MDEPHPVDNLDLWSMAAHLLSAPDSSTLLARIVTAAQQVSGAAGVAILLYNRELGFFEPVTPSVSVGLDPTWLRGRGLPATHSLAAQALESDGIVDLQNTATMPDMEFPLLAGGLRPGAVSVAPLKVDDQFIGVLGLYHLAPRAEPVNHAHLQAFAAMAAPAIFNAQVHQRERTLAPGTAL
jgi:GAF domain-containing protein